MRILAKRPICEICWEARATQLHHCIEGRMKGHPELDHEINLEPVCATCHMEGKGDSPEHAMEFALRQMQLGFDVLSWYENRVDLVVLRFPNLRAMVTG